MSASATSPAAAGRPRLGTVLFTAERIRERLEEVAGAMAGDYGRIDLLAVAILNGSFVFAADLARALSVCGVHLAIDFMTLSSYGDSTVSPGRIDLLHEVTIPLAGRPVLLMDDILDSGLTLQTARRHLLDRGAASVRTCVLLDKPSRRRVPVEADYVAFRIDDVFVVGYGLDYDGRYRHLPYVAELTFEGDAP
jgi:hypoxanthine phosphoribosyltransferase